MKKTILLVLVLALGLAAEVANADFVFGTPVNLGPIVNSAGFDGQPSISSNGLELFFTSNRSGAVERCNGRSNSAGLFADLRSISCPAGPHKTSRQALKRD